jgi:hypothetical protein
MLSLFIPSHIKEKFIIKTTNLYVYINGKDIQCNLVVVEGNTRAIIKQAHKTLELLDTSDDIQTLIGKTIAELIFGWKFDYCVCVIPSRDVMYKVMEFPFDDMEKIKMVIPFEIESQLPVPLSDCSIDALLLERKVIDKKNIIAKVLAVIMKQESVSFYREIFKKSLINLNSITVDIAEIIIDNQKKKMEKDSYIIFIENNIAINALIYVQGALQAVRLIYEFKDTTDIFSSDVLKQQDSNTNEENNKDKNTFEKEEIKNDTKEDSLHTEITQYHNPTILEEELSHSVKPINSKEKTIQNKNLFIKENGLVSKIDSLISFIIKQYNISKDFLGLYCIGKNLTEESVFASGTISGISLEKYQEIKYIKNDIKLIFKETINESVFKNTSSELVLVYSMAWYESLRFNLALEEKAVYAKQQIKKQIITFFILIILVIVTFFTWNFIKINNYKKAVDTIEHEAINFLKREFSLTARHTGSLEKALKECEQIINFNENTIPPLVVDSKYQFLTIFDSLSNILDKDLVKGFEINEMRWKNNISNNTNQFFIQGYVADFNSLHIFEKTLQETNLFMFVPPLQNTKFNLTLLVHKMRNVEL